MTPEELSRAEMRIAEVVEALVRTCVMAGLVFKEGLIAFRVCARLMQQCDETPDMSEGEMAALGRKWAQEELLKMESKGRVM